MPTIATRKHDTTLFDHMLFFTQELVLIYQQYLRKSAHRASTVFSQHSPVVNSLPAASTTGSANVLRAGVARTASRPVRRPSISAEMKTHQLCRMRLSSGWGQAPTAERWRAVSVQGRMGRYELQWCVH
jgi:hypothetical protein